MGISINCCVFSSAQMSLPSGFVSPRHLLDLIFYPTKNERKSFGGIVTRNQLEHLIRASGGIADSKELVVVGSQAILGQFPDAPAEFLISIEADIYPADDPEKSILIDGAIGERSIFHETFGYYAHGVAADTAILPDGFRERLIPIQNENTLFVTGWCLEIHDLAASKLAAGRDKDISFVRALITNKLVDLNILNSRVELLQTKSEIATDRLSGLVSQISVSLGCRM